MLPINNSNIFGIGTDIVNINRFTKIISQYNKKTLLRIFTEQELDYCFSKPLLKKQASSMALRFAAKEALSKAIGLGVRKIKLYEIEIINNEFGQPKINLLGGTKQIVDNTLNNQDYQLHLSLSDEFPYALAFITISCKCL